MEWRSAHAKWQPPSPVRPADDGHQFGDLVALVVLIAARDGVLDAMADVIAQHLFLDPPQRRANRRDLRDDVNAIAVLLDHFGQPAHLTLDAAEPLLNRRLDVFLHAAYIPLHGMGFKRRWRQG
jgi:hypothetical protein